MSTAHDHTSTVTRMVTITRSRRSDHVHDESCGHDIITTMRIAELTALLHLASPALPIGAFSYSQGLEAAIEAQLDHRRRFRAATGSRAA